MLLAPVRFAANIFVSVSTASSGVVLAAVMLASTDRTMDNVVFVGVLLVAAAEVNNARLTSSADPVGVVLLAARFAANVYPVPPAPASVISKMMPPQLPTLWPKSLHVTAAVVVSVL